MPSNKRKKGHDEVGDTEDQTTANSDTEHTLPSSSPRLHPQTRRSKRRATAVPRGSSNMSTTQPPPPPLTPTSMVPAVGTRLGTSPRPGDSADVMRRAREELTEMERRLQSAAKKQREAIEESDLQLSPDFEDGHSLEATAPCQRQRLLRKNTRAQPQQAEGEKRSGDGDAGHTRDEAAQAGEITLVPSVSENLLRPAPVNSGYLPLPWKGRLGYACLNTYLRTAMPPVFCSRTCRLASILEHRHPLAEPSAPEHPIRNRPDRSKPADPALGVEFVRRLGLANAQDIPRMLRWNDRYGIRFLRLSSEMFPFASHAEHGYRLAPFAAHALADAGRVAAVLGHRLTTHPGQFTQLGSPRAEVVEAAIRDLEYHDELLSLLKLPTRLDRDAVVVIHMGGTYGDKAAALNRFRQNYSGRLSDGVKRRLVLENDDVAWSVHDLLPICEELKIPLVLDWHHHNIVHDATMREGTADIMPLLPRIANTWSSKGITQKMHYSEPRRDAVTARDRRKHSARVLMLPPCSPEMDLMIEAKDKEQAVFELMKLYKTPGWDKINDILPFERCDDGRASNDGGGMVADERKKRKQAGNTANTGRKKTIKGNKGAATGVSVSSADEGGNNDDVDVSTEETTTPTTVVPDEDFAMGGPERRVYWPEGTEEWLKPKKKWKKTEVKLEDEEDGQRGQLGCSE